MPLSRVAIVGIVIPLLARDDAINTDVCSHAVSREELDGLS
jgi:hypothetical protein